MWGRAYYSLFLAVRTEIRKTDGLPVHGRDDNVSHGALQNSLYSSGSKDLAALAKLLEQLYERRRQADYVLDPETRWVNELKPAKADRKARQVEAFIQSKLRLIDFTPMKGKV